MAETIRILLVDDHSIVRQGIRVFLETQVGMVIVGEASSGEEAIKLVPGLTPDVVVIDLSMPGMGGIEAIRQIKKLSPGTEIVALTSFQEDEYIFPTLKAGALSYIMKDIHARDLADTIRKAARGESVLHPRVAARVVQELRGGEKKPPNIFSELSNREIEVLRLIGLGYNNMSIAQKLSISEQTVKGHVGNIFSKLHITDRTQAAVFAWQHGFIQRQSETFLPGSEEEEKEED